VELTCGRLVLNAAEHRVLVRGVEVNFSPKEFEVLQYLMLGFPKLVSLDELVRNFADGDPTHAIRVRITVSRIRTKFALAAPGLPPIIETIRGIGYRIAG
jgi:DNA-binding response OmpR family regulator